MAENKTPLVAMTLDELKNAAKELGMPAFTGAQMAKYEYLYQTSLLDFYRGRQLTF